MRRRLAASIAVALLALAPAGCLGGDDDEDAAEAQDYALAVERVTDDVGETAERALTRLNRVADESSLAVPAARALDRDARRVEDAAAELGALDPPPEAESAADDLGFVMDDLTLDLAMAATDLRTFARRVIGLGAAVDGSRRVILARSSAIGSLSRAVRTIAQESAE
jgi:hypothetical protein